MRRTLAKILKRRIKSASIRRRLVQVETSYELLRNTASTLLPSLIVPSPRLLMVAITAKCNLKCVGCRYGRDYMVGHELPTQTVIDVVRDAAAAGISTVRLYGGEPLLHAGLPEMIKESIACGVTPFVSTNGLILKRRIDAMVDAGLRIITFGYYGHGEGYDSYVGKKGAWDRFEASVADARNRYKDLQLHMSYVLNTRTCSTSSLDYAWTFAKRYGLLFHVDLVHYSLPYFSEGPDRELQFTSEDAGRINAIVAELANMKLERADLYQEPDVSIRSIPDWLLKGPEMRVPCDAYNMIWVGADGSVRLCFVTFPLGNVHDTPLRTMMFGPAHKAACIDANKLACPNCHCSRDTRIVKHLPSLLRYSRPSPASLADPPDRAGPFVIVPQ